MIAAWLAVAFAQSVQAPPMIWSGCTWTDAAFEHSVGLKVPGERGAVVDVWGSPSVSVTASLGQDLGLLPAFAGVWSSGGVSVAGYADLQGSAGLRLSGDDPVAMGPAAHLVVGGSLEPFAFLDGVPLVRPHPWAMNDVKRGAGYAKVPCERLSVARSPWLDDASIVAAVYGAGLETQILAPGTGLKLRDRPDGLVAVVSKRFDYERTVWIVARSGPWTHVAVPDWTGVVWHGWVDTLPAPDGSTEGSGGLGMLGSGLGGEAVPVVTCAEPRLLWAASRRKRLPLGLVDAGTPLDVEVEDDDAPAVRVSWLGTREGWWIELDAAGCTRKTRDPDPPLKLDDLLSPAIVEELPPESEAATEPPGPQQAP